MIRRHFWSAHSGLLIIALFCLGLPAVGVPGSAPAGEIVAPPRSESKPPHVVFVTGDEEYRSEESMPMLAKILHHDHRFKVTVCYALDRNGVIDPNNLKNIAGLEALDDADLMVMFTRFRQLPDDQLEHIVRYADSGKPMVG